MMKDNEQNHNNIIELLEDLPTSEEQLDRTTITTTTTTTVASTDQQTKDDVILSNAKNSFKEIVGSLANNNRILNQFISYLQTEIKTFKKLKTKRNAREPNHRTKERKKKKDASTAGDNGVLVVEDPPKTEEVESTPRSTKRTRRPTSYAAKLLSENEDEEEDETFGRTTKRTKPKRKSKKQYNEDPKTILYSTDSALCDVDLRDIVNFKNFDTLLTAEEKDKLLDDLPPADRKSLESITDLFKSSELSADFERYKELLEGGAFDKNGLRKQPKERPLDPWKVKYFEEYWGQKKDDLQLPSDKQKEEEPLFSFVEYEKDNPRPDKVVVEEEVDPPLVKRLKKKRKRNSNVGSGENKEKRVGLSKRRKNKPGMRVLTEEEEKRKEQRSSSLLTTTLSAIDSDVEFYSSDDLTVSTTTSKGKGRDQKHKKDASGKNSFRTGAYTILKREERPLSAHQIAKIGLEEGLFTTSGKTPHNTLAALLYCDIKKNKETLFTKVKAMTFGLKEWQ